MVIRFVLSFIDTKIKFINETDTYEFRVQQMGIPDRAEKYKLEYIAWGR